MPPIGAEELDALHAVFDRPGAFMEDLRRTWADPLGGLNDRSRWW